MSIYKIPLKYKKGKFKFSEHDAEQSEESLFLDYDTEYQTLTYDVPAYGNEITIYTVPREVIPKGLTALYGDGGELDKVELIREERTRLIYIRFKNAEEAEKAVLKFVKEQADRICAEIIGRKQKLARLFFGAFYDGAAVQMAAVTGTAEEMKAVTDYYRGDPDSADNSGNYPLETNMISLDYEALGVMLLCGSREYKNSLFKKAQAAAEERIKSVLDKTDKTDDFKFISEEWD